VNYDTLRIISLLHEWYSFSLCDIPNTSGSRYVYEHFLVTCNLCPFTVTNTSFFIVMMELLAPFC